MTAVEPSTTDPTAPTQNTAPIYLAIDSSATASVALIQSGHILAEQSTDSVTTHAEVLAPLVHDLLTSHQLDGAQLTGIFAGVGPGPFTGLRAGLMTAEALGFAWSIPVHGVMSLDALALPAAQDAWSIGVEEFVVAIDARRREVYWAHYSTVGGQPQRLHGPFVTAPADVTPLPVYGSGAGLYPEQLNGITGWEHRVPAAGQLGLIGELGLRRGRGLEPVVPLYLRESDAKVPTRR